MQQSNHRGCGFVLVFILAAFAMILRFGFPFHENGKIVLPEAVTSAQTNLENIIRPKIHIAPEVSIPDASSGTFDPLYAICYSQLTETEQIVYRQMYQAIIDCSDSFDLTETISVDALQRIASALQLDQPQLFWWEGGYSYLTYQRALDQPVTVKPDYNDLADNLEVHKQEFSSAANAILTEAKKLEKPQDRELYVHNALIDSIHYAGARYDQTAYSALVGHETVCAGYTRAFQYLMMQLDIPCYYCSGTASKDEKTAPEAHSWNIIQLNNSYYNIDVTWDDADQSAASNFIYFNCTDAYFTEKRHMRSAKDNAFTFPECTDTICTFDNLFGTEPLVSRLSSYGITEESVILSKEHYFLYCRQQLMNIDVDTGSFSMIIQGKDVFDAIWSLTSDELGAGFVNEVLRASMLYSSFSQSLTSQQLSESCYLVTMQYTLK